MRIGICRALHAFYHFALWKTFFNELGIEVVTTISTTKKIIEEGLKVAPAELCLPVKVFLGHVVSLKEKVDALLIPRLVCRKIAHDFYFGCPKALALPDLTRAVFPDLLRVIELVIDERISSEKAAFVNLAQSLGMKKPKAIKAYRLAKAAALDADNLTKRLGSPLHMFEHQQAEPVSPEAHRLKIGLIGHPYLLFDGYLNCGIFKLIESCGVAPVFFSPDEQQITQGTFEKTLINWYYELKLIIGARHLIQDEKISGLVLFSNFACGTGSVVNEIVRKQVFAKKNIPLLTLLIDEHTGETGLKTRLESFIDLIKVKG